MTSQSSAGARGRIIVPSPPAPVPQPRPAQEPVPAEPVTDKSSLKSEAALAAAAAATATTATTTTATTAAAGGGSDGNSDADVVRAGGSMAIATLISRITGFIRTVLITSSLGAAIASAFQTANQIPNLITEIVLGAVLTSLVVPVLIHAEKEDPDRGEEFVRRLFTLSVVILGGVTILSVIFAPALTRMMLREDGQVNVAQATSMAYLLLPQIFFYGLFALFQAVLNTKNVFAPGAWAPVINNIISISVLLLYWLLPGELNPAAPSPVSDPHVLLLGIGTTLGVVVQCLILVPYLLRAGINLTPLWGIDDRLKQFGGMAVAIIAYVAISQAGYIVTSQIASMSSSGAPAIYQNHWLLLQVPYGIIGVTLLTAIMPRLSRNAANGDVDAVVRDLTLGTKLTFIALIPIVIFFTGFGVPIARGLFGYGRLDVETAELLGLTLSFSAFTLIPYALVLLHLRVFYAREEAWTPTFIIAGITITKVVLSLAAPHIANSPGHVVVLLGAANGFGFVAGAVIGAFLLKRKLGSLGGRAVMETTVWSTVAGAIGLVAAWALNWLLRLVLPEFSFVVLLRVAIDGVLFLIVTGLILSRSKLPEVLNLGRALQRIPGMSRIITVSEDSGIQVEEPELAEIRPQYTLDAFNSSPVPPPMSAGIVRGPSLVPGAPVSDGRFRLLRDHGSVPGARFWQAREQATGRIVALTFVDCSNKAPLAPATPAEVAKRSSEVSRATRKLADAGLGSVAPHVDVLSYRAGCLVVADWVDGTELKTVAEDGALDPGAVAHALAPLLADAAAAHAAGLTLGVENRNRFRVNTDGEVVLAFPAVLSDATPDTDRAALGSAVRLLVGATDPTPETLRDIADSTTLAANATDGADGTDTDGAPTGDPAIEPASLADLAQRLAAFAPGSGELPVEDASAEAADAGDDEEIDDRPGFGGRPYSSTGIVLLGVLATAFVVGMAALTVWIMSLIGEESPVDSTSLQGTSASVPDRPAIILDPARATSPTGTPENAIDGDKHTAWTTSKADMGITVSVDDATQMRYLIVAHDASTGTEYHVYGRATGSEGTAERVELASGTLAAGRNSIKLGTSDVAFDAVEFWVDALPKANEVSITELQLVGLPH